MLLAKPMNMKKSTLPLQLLLAAGILVASCSKTSQLKQSKRDQQQEVAVANRTQTAVFDPVKDIPPSPMPIDTLELDSLNNVHTE